jgi:hypothetical protein
MITRQHQLGVYGQVENNPAIAPSSSQIHYTQTFVVVSDPIAGQKSAQSGDIRQCLCPYKKKLHHVHGLEAKVNLIRCIAFLDATCWNITLLFYTPSFHIRG